MHILEVIFDCLINTNLWAAAGATALIFADVVTGIMKGFATKTLSSEKMRIGFWNKSANLFIVYFAYATTAAGQFLPNAGDWVSVVYMFVAGYVSVMETTSILENLAEINPELNKRELFEHFNIKIRGKDDDSTQ